MRIYRMYKDYSHNELQREKIGTLNSIQNMIETTSATQSELIRLSQENHELKSSIARYKQIIEDFDNEYAGMKKFAARKQTENQIQKGKQAHRKPSESVEALDRATGDFDFKGDQKY